MIELNNISFREYTELEDRSDYDYAVEFAFSFNKPVDYFKIGDVMKLTFGTVKDLQYDLQTGLTWEMFFDYISSITRKSVKSVAENKLINICQGRAYLIQEIERIIEIENIALAYDPDDDEVNAGLETLSDFGPYLQIRKVAITFCKSTQEVREWPYELCFTELVTQKRIYDFEKALMNIRRNKNNPN